jgi:hypothetical protein
MVSRCFWKLHCSYKLLPINFVFFFHTTDFPLFATTANFLIFPLFARAEHFRFGPVLNQNKQLNRIIFLIFWTEPNRKSIQTD